MSDKTRWRLSTLTTGSGLFCMVLSASTGVPVVAVMGLALVALGWLATRRREPGAATREQTASSSEAHYTRREEWRSLGSAAIFTLVAFFFLRSWEVAWVVMASLAVHELGHMLAARAMGVPAVMGFSLMGAWTRTPLQQRAALSQAANTLIHLAGPVASLTYALIALSAPLWLSGSHDGDYWLRLANLNALLCLINILPFGQISDGGKSLHRLLQSATRRTRQELLLLFILVPVALGWAMIRLPLKPVHVLALVTTVLWFGVALLRHNRAARLATSEPRRPMPGGQARLLLAASLILLIASIIMILVTPFWLTEAQALGIAYGIGSLVHFVIFESPLILRLSMALAVVLLGLVWARGLPGLLQRRQDGP